MRFRVCAGIFALVSIGLAADVRVVEEIVAKVNGDIITKGEIERSRQQIESELKQQGLSGASLEKTVAERQKDALRDQIDQLLLVQHGKDLNINVDGEVTKRIAAIQLDSKIADPDKFHDYIREQTQMPFEDFRQKIRDQILTQRVIGQEVGSKINVPHSEIEKYYEEHKKEFIREEQVFLSEILISTEGKTADQAAQAEKRAKDIVARLRKGENSVSWRGNIQTPKPRTTSASCRHTSAANCARKSRTSSSRRRRATLRIPSRCPMASRS